MSETIQYQLDKPGVAVLSLDVADRPMNVISPEFISELDACIDRIANDDEVKGVVIRSGKPDFLAGADLKELAAALERGISLEQGYQRSQAASTVFRRLETCGKPVAVAINGLALGGGLELCLACHYRVLADDPSARVGLPEVTIGLLPGVGGTQRLPRLIGIREALPLMLEGRQIEPAKALEMGIVNELAPAGEIVSRARRWVLDGGLAQAPWDQPGFRIPGGAGAMHPKAVETFMVGTSLMGGKTFHNYPAPKAIMSAVYEGTMVPLDTGLRIESQYFGQLISGPVARNMIRTLFINKGEADKLVRRPQGVDPSKVQKLGILGAGMMGAGIAYASARAGIPTVLLDTELARAERGKAYSRELLDKAVARGKSTAEQAAAVLDLITPTMDYADLGDCDLVVEAVFEDRAVKARATEQAESVIPEQAIFASNTSTLPITGLAEASARPGNFIGIHFFSPVDKMALVEVIVGRETSDEAIARSLDFIRQLRKTPIVVNDSRGFFTSRCFTTFTNEGMTMLAEGISPVLIEHAAKMASMPVGPLAVMDEVSIELGYHITRQTQEDLGEAWEPMSGFEVMRRMVEEFDRKGKRHGAGFYDYPTEGRKRLWPGLAEHYPPAPEQPSIEELELRLLVIQALETARCFEEGVIRHAADADIGSIFGWGFPPWTGGTLSYIDTMGLDRFVSECDRLAQAFGSRFAVSDWLRERAATGQVFHPHS